MVCWYQQSTELLIHKWPFVHLVYEIAQGYGAHNLHFQVCVVQALQEATEYSLMGILNSTNFCAIHAKHVTIIPKDIHLACHVCGEQKMLHLFLSVVCGSLVFGKGIMTEKQRDFLNTMWNLIFFIFNYYIVLLPWPS